MNTVLSLIPEYITPGWDLFADRIGAAAGVFLAQGVWRRHSLPWADERAFAFSPKGDVTY